MLKHKFYYLSIGPVFWKPWRILYLHLTLPQFQVSLFLLVSNFFYILSSCPPYYVLFKTRLFFDHNRWFLFQFILLILLNTSVFYHCIIYFEFLDPGSLYHCILYSFICIPVSCILYPCILNPVWTEAWIARVKVKFSFWLTLLHPVSNHFNQFSSLHYSIQYLIISTNSLVYTTLSSI